MLESNSKKKTITEIMAEYLLKSRIEGKKKTKTDSERIDKIEIKNSYVFLLNLLRGYAFIKISL